MRLPSILAAAFAAAAIVSCKAPESTPDTPGNTEPAPVASTANAAIIGKKVALKGSNGTYVGCELKEGHALRERLLCNRAYIGDWEKFTVSDAGDGHIALQAANGKFVASDLDQGRIMLASRDGVGPWESFELVDGGNGLKALKAVNTGLFVTAEYALPGDSAGFLLVNGASVGDGQRFELIVEPQ